MLTSFLASHNLDVEFSGIGMQHLSFNLKPINLPKQQRENFCFRKLSRDESEIETIENVLIKLKGNNFTVTEET